MALGQSKIPLSFHKPNYLYHNNRQELFGELDVRNGEILSDITSEDGIELQIYGTAINQRAAHGGKESRKTGVIQRQYRMNTIIYGPKVLCDNVGDYLAKCKIYLQDPVGCDRDVLYSNPQSLSRSEKHITTYELASLNATSDVERVISQDDIFSELSSDDYLTLTEAPSSVITELYR